jgi:hypothetical protein
MTSAEPNSFSLLAAYQEALTHEIRGDLAVISAELQSLKNQDIALALKRCRSLSEKLTFLPPIALPDGSLTDIEDSAYPQNSSKLGWALFNLQNIIFETLSLPLIRLVSNNHITYEGHLVNQFENIRGEWSSFSCFHRSILHSEHIVLPWVDAILDSCGYKVDIELLKILKIKIY